MQLYRVYTNGLDAMWHPDKQIENYSSLIWTERYRPAGDFELKTADITKTMAELPLGSCVTLIDTREVMMVETHEVEVDADGKYVLTVRGRTIETFFENRTTLINEDPIKSAIDDTNAVMINDREAAYAAQKIIDNARSDLLDGNCGIDWITGTANAEAIIDVDLKDRFVPRGRAYDAFLKILEEENLGVRNIRPTTYPGSLNVNVYLSHTGETNLPNVVLDVSSGHFLGPVSYIWSIRDYKTAVYVASKNYFVKVFRSGMSGYSDLDHRVDLLDFSDITQTGTKIPTMLRAKGKTYLNEHRKVLIISGNVSPDIPYKYKTDYGLGDRLRIKGEFGTTDEMQVTEYIRVEDQNGERGYPTLS